ncbi:MAG TPA: hypothetical protein VLS96_01810 [Nodosilinea sp.]|nr:hypothetical protein [Nodosilinea sp.]
MERHSEAVQKLTEATKKLNICLAAYQQASQWVVNLALGLLATATITPMVTAVIR